MSDSITFRDGKPAIDVKDRRTYHQESAEVKALIDALPDERVQAIYEGVQSDFWTLSAPERAMAHGYGGVYSEGRSSGWLLVDKPPTLDYDEGDELGLSKLAVSAARAEWLKFEKEIEQEIEGCRAIFAEDLAEALTEHQADRRVKMVAAMSPEEVRDAASDIIGEDKLPRGELDRIVLDHGDLEGDQ